MKKTTIAGLVGLLFTSSAFAADVDVTSDEVVVSASRFAENAPKIPANVTVITKEEIQNTPAISIPDILATRAGINVSSLYGRSGIDSAVDIRGFGDSGLSNTLILLDGQRINTVDASSIQWSSIPLQALERIEIIRGSGSVLFGDRASGGVINLITDKSKGNALSTKATLGSYGYKAFDGYVSGRSDNLYFNTFVNNEDGNGWRENTQFNKLSVSGRGGIDFDKGGVFIDYSAYRVSNGLPGSLINQAYSSPRNASTHFDSQEKEGYRIRPGISVAITDKLQLETETAFTKEELSTQYISFGGSADRSVETASFTPRIRWQHGLGSLESQTVAGFDYYHGRVNANSSFSPNQNAAQNSKAIYFQNSTNLTDTLILTLGGRSQNMKQNAHQDDGGPFSPALNGSSDRTRSIYDTGLTYTTSAWSVYGKTGSTFRYANTDELFGFDPITGAPTFSGDIKPQHGYNNEIGAKFNSGNFDGKVSLYKMNLNDEIGYDATVEKNLNYDPTRHQGIETELGWKFSDELKALLAYAYTEAEFRSGIHDGKTIPSVPNNKATAQLSWLSPAYGNYTTQVNYTGKRYFANDFDNLKSQLPAYVTLDMRASWKVKSLTISASGLNLLDKRYSQYGVYAAPDFFNPTERFAYYPADGRLLFVSLGYDFK